jgi:diacylglycerol kinase
MARTVETYNAAVEACVQTIKEMKIKTADRDAGSGYVFNETLNEIIKAIRKLRRPVT